MRNAWRNMAALGVFAAGAGTIAAVAGGGPGRQGTATCTKRIAQNDEAEHVRFWTNKWEGYREQGIRPGFHNLEVNKNLLRYSEKFLTRGKSEERIFVPLCGKTVDLVFLQQYGEVAGVEVSQLAIDEFGQEQGLTPDPNLLSESEGHIFRYTNQRANDGITIGKFDVFALPHNWNQSKSPRRPGFSACFDRAALVAIHPTLRKAYAQMMEEQIEARGKVLLVTLEYDQTRSDGPPFSIGEREVRSYFASGFDVELLHKKDIIGEEIGQRWRKKNHEYLNECVFLLTRHANKL